MVEQVIAPWSVDPSLRLSPDSLNTDFCNEKKFIQAKNGSFDRREIALRIAKLIVDSVGKAECAVFLLGSLVNKAHSPTSDFDLLVFVTDKVENLDITLLQRRISLFLSSVGFSTNDLALDIVWFNPDEVDSGLSREPIKIGRKKVESNRAFLVGHQMQLFNARYRSCCIGGSLELAKTIFEFCPEYFWNDSLKKFFMDFQHYLVRFGTISAILPNLFLIPCWQVINLRFTEQFAKIAIFSIYSNYLLDIRQLPISTFQCTGLLNGYINSTEKEILELARPFVTSLTSLAGEVHKFVQITRLTGYIPI